ncbi:hypothetical protein A2223_00055 [Candidatus Falkowbacteria bacterium RIFOXYA2_FULL_35_8]|nr:MAG: hypothetical protein A2223_00055 [Candidatus Falkowbacteria bacterium RIFOXYA2_FULL_35_8]
MKSVERRYAEVTRKNPNKGSYICFCEAIENQRFNKRILSKWFYKLVNKDDYFVSDGIKDLINHFYRLSNPVKEN